MYLEKKKKRGGFDGGFFFDFQICTFGFLSVLRFALHILKSILLSNWVLGYMQH